MEKSPMIEMAKHIKPTPLSRLMEEIREELETKFNNKTIEVKEMRYELEFNRLLAYKITIRIIKKLINIIYKFD